MSLNGVFAVSVIGRLARPPVTLPLTSVVGLMVPPTVVKWLTTAVEMVVGVMAGLYWNSSEPLSPLIELVFTTT